MLRALCVILVIVGALCAGAQVACRIGEDYVLKGYLPNEVEARFAERSCQRIEGVWRLTRGGADVAIESNDDGLSYRIVVVDAPNRTLLPGTVVGDITPAGNENMFIATMFTRLKGDMLMMPMSFSVRLNEKRGLLEFMKNRSSLRINLWHFVPFLYRNSVNVLQGGGSAHNGAVRVFPKADVPDVIVYL